MEHAIPLEWRTAVQNMVTSFISGDFTLSHSSFDRIAPVDPIIAQSIAANISAYGCTLAPLNPAVWGRAVYRWMDGYWQFLIDLTTTAEPVSDLVIHARLRDDGLARLEVQSVHVP
ncbi:hypothetical protein [Sphingobium sp.]|uniref:DUF7668 domain-containing protein n=1 Tax=Sphingobium sp. TaxID=1912891 RepID=UPI00261BCF8E|nr:hypothetical protein [Sphingobium sp.]